MRTNIILVSLVFTACAKEPSAIDSTPPPVAPAAPVAEPEPAPDDGMPPISELYDYERDSTGAVGPFDEFVPAAGEKVFTSELNAAKWMPGSSVTRPFPSIDIVLVERAGKAHAVFQSAPRRRATISFGLDLSDLEITSPTIEERPHRRVMISLAEITFGDREGDIEAFLVGWNDKTNAPVTVEHWRGTADSMPSWAKP